MAGSHNAAGASGSKPIAPTTTSHEPDLRAIGASRGTSQLRSAPWVRREPVARETRKSGAVTGRAASGNAPVATARLLDRVPRASSPAPRVFRGDPSPTVARGR